MPVLTDRDQYGRLLLKGGGQMNEELLQDVSRALTHLVYRNSVVEDLHAAGAVLDDPTMKIINKEVNNRIYTLLKWYTSDSEEDRERVAQLVAFSSLFGKGTWDPAEMMDESDF